MSSQPQHDDRTPLALQRTVMAAERTMMAWLRTALSMISFGFTMVKLFQFLASSDRGPLVGLFGRTWTPSAVGLSMLTIGIGSLIVAIVQHWNVLKFYRSEGSEGKFSLALAVSTLVAVLGLFALISLVAGE